MTRRSLHNAAYLSPLSCDALGPTQHSGPRFTILSRETAAFAPPASDRGSPLRHLVASLSRPGANVTGLTFFNRDLNLKRLELLKEMLPKLKRLGVLFDSKNPIAHQVLPVIMIAPSR